MINTPAPRRNQEALCFALSGLIPLLLLSLWNHYSNFYVVFDDGEYWHQAYTVLRSMKYGHSVWSAAYQLGTGRPSIHFIYGLVARLLTGQGVSASTRIVLGFFYVFLSLGVYSFVNAVCRTPGWSLVVTLWTVLQANYFFTAQIFLSELPFFGFFTWCAYCVLRSESFHHRSWSVLAGVCAAMAVCSRPIEGTILFGLFGLVTTISLVTSRVLRPVDTLPPAVALAGSILLCALLLRTYSNDQSSWLYLTVPACTALAVMGYRLRNAKGNYWLATGTAGALIFVWYVPRVLLIYYWVSAAAYTDQMSMGEVTDFQVLRKTVSLVLTVCNEMAGPHLILLGLIAIAALGARKKIRETYWVGATFLVFLASILPGGFVKNPSTQEAIDRYYLGEILALHVSIGVAAFLVSQRLLRRVLMGSVAALACLHLFLIIGSIFFPSSPLMPRTDGHPWITRSLVRDALRIENPYWAVTAVDQIKALLPGAQGRTMLYLAPGTGIAHRFLSLRGLELDQPWDLQASIDLDPRVRRDQESSLRSYYGYVLAGPAGMPGTQELIGKIRFQGGVLLGQVTFRLSQSDARMELYRIPGN